jgi:hypothetical protein
MKKYLIFMTNWNKLTSHIKIRILKLTYIHNIFLFCYVQSLSLESDVFVEHDTSDQNREVIIEHGEWWSWLLSQTCLLEIWHHVPLLHSPVQPITSTRV